VTMEYLLERSLVAVGDARCECAIVTVARALSTTTGGGHVGDAMSGRPGHIRPADR
jgi:hypothetical protein